MIFKKNWKKTQENERARDGNLNTKMILLGDLMPEEILKKQTKGKQNKSE